MGSTISLPKTANMSDSDPFYDKGKDKENMPPQPASLGTPRPQQNFENHSISDMSSHHTFDSNAENQPPPLPETPPSPPSRESEYITRAHQVPFNNLPAKYTGNDSDASSATEYEHDSDAEHENNNPPPLPDFFQFPVINYNALEPTPIPPGPFRRAGTPFNHDSEVHEIIYASPDSPPPVDINMSDTSPLTDYGSDQEGQPVPFQQRLPTPFNQGSDNGDDIFGRLQNQETWPELSVASSCGASRGSQDSLPGLVESSIVLPELGNQESEPNGTAHSNEAVFKVVGDFLASTNTETPATPAEPPAPTPPADTIASTTPTASTLAELRDEFHTLTTQINKIHASITFHRSDQETRILRYLNVNRLPLQTMSWADPNLAVREEIRELGNKKQELMLFDQYWTGSEKELRKRMAREPTIGYVTQQRVRLLDLGMLKGKRGGVVRRIGELRGNSNATTTGNDVTPLPAIAGNQVEVQDERDVVEAETEKMEDEVQKNVDAQIPESVVGVMEVCKDGKQVLVGSEEKGMDKGSGEKAVDADSEMIGAWKVGG
ncbi:hypothetical protein B0J14DRAFT_578979 [Halenospora varia]|nr:hypothetical protein B0J14DRAFT_578979 [Halenospora varia]